MTDPHATTVFEGARLALGDFLHCLVVISMLCSLYVMATANTRNIYYCIGSLVLISIIGLLHILHLVIAMQEISLWSTIWNASVVGSMVGMEILSTLEACKQAFAAEVPGLTASRELLQEEQAQLKIQEGILKKLENNLDRQRDILSKWEDNLSKREEALIKQEEKLKKEEERLTKAERPNSEGLESHQTAEEMS